MTQDFALEVRRKRDIVSNLTSYLNKFIGVKYKYGGSNPISGFDCSGLVLEGLKAVGYLPHACDLNSQALYDHLQKIGNGVIPIEVSEGCLVFFGKDKKSIDHVAYAISNTLIIEAGGGDSTTLTAEDAEAKNAFVRIRPIKYRKAYVGAMLPNY